MSQPICEIKNIYLIKSDFKYHLTKCKDVKKQKYNTSVDYSYQNITDEKFEVCLNLKVNSFDENNNAKIFDLSVIYGGIFHIANLEEHQFGEILDFQAVKILFHHAQELIYNITNRSLNKGYLFPATIFSKKASENFSAFKPKQHYSLND